MAHHSRNETDALHRCATLQKPLTAKVAKKIREERKEKPRTLICFATLAGVLCDLRG